MSAPSGIGSAIDVSAPECSAAVRCWLGRCWRGVAASWRSVTRSLRLLGRVHAALVVVLLVGLYEHWVGWVAGSASAAVLLLAWPGIHTRSWTVVVERWHTKRWYRRHWGLVCGRVGLSVHRSPADQHLGRHHRTRTTGSGSAGRVVQLSVTVVPRLLSVRVSGPLVVLRARCELISAISCCKCWSPSAVISMAVCSTRTWPVPEERPTARRTRMWMP